MNQTRRVTDSAATVTAIRHALLLQADASALPLADETVDLIVTSPSYDAGVAYDTGGDVAAAVWPAFMTAWLAEAYRVTRPSTRRWRPARSI